MLQIDHDKEFQAQASVLEDERGNEIACATVKATFALHAPARLHDEQCGISAAYAHVGEPGVSSLAGVPEHHLPTGGTDIVLLSEACAPSARAVTQLDVGLSVAGRQLVARVMGERRWRSYLLGMATRPTPFTRMPLTYERAYGGSSKRTDGSLDCLATNPIGRGYRGGRSARAMRGTALPNIEDPGAPLERAIGFGYIAPQWQPRADFAGTYDEQWLRQRAPLLPRDFDRRFWRCGPPRLHFEKPLRGGEIITLMHVAPQPLVKVELPKHALELIAHDAAVGVPMTLETVVLEPLESRFSLIWRAALPPAQGQRTPERVRARWRKVS